MSERIHEQEVSSSGPMACAPCVALMEGEVHDDMGEARNGALQLEWIMHVHEGLFEGDGAQVHADSFGGDALQGHMRGDPHEIADSQWGEGPLGCLFAQGFGGVDVALQGFVDHGAPLALGVRTPRCSMLNGACQCSVHVG